MTGKIDDYLSYRKEFAITDNKNTERSACYDAFNERAGSA